MIIQTPHQCLTVASFDLTANEDTLRLQKGGCRAMGAKARQNRLTQTHRPINRDSAKAPLSLTYLVPRLDGEIVFLFGFEIESFGESDGSGLFIDGEFALVSVFDGIFDDATLTVVGVKRRHDHHHSTHRSVLQNLHMEKIRAVG